MKQTLTILLLICFSSSFAQTKDTISIDTFIGRKYKTVLSISATDANYKIVYDYNSRNYISTVPVELKKYISIRTRSFVPSVSVITIPFKVRPAREGLPQFANTAIKNAGIFAGPYLKTERYFANGKISTHKFAVGLTLAPSAEEYTPENTRGKVAKSSQLVLSSGITFTYTFNAISFAIIPLGVDYALTGQGHDWVYDKKRWFGFGIGVDTKLFGF